jgi:hypothetical protein
VHVRAVRAAAVVAFLFFVRASAPEHATASTVRHMPLQESVVVDLRTFDMHGETGAASLHAFHIGQGFVVDPHLLSLTAKPHGAADATELAIDSTIGPPVSNPLPAFTPPPEPRMWELTMPVGFHGPPGPPGLYDVQLHAADGFAHTSDGTALPLGDWSNVPGSFRGVMWWPDETGGDSKVVELRRRFVGRDVYGYGGSAIRCGKYSRSVPATTAVRVRSVERDRGQIETLWTGSTVGWLNDAAPHFFAIEPIRIVVDQPSAEAPTLFGFPQGNPPGCWSMVLADWQVDLTLSAEPPPTVRPGNSLAPALKIGMSREEVRWQLGYPNEYGDKSALDREETWSYDNAPFNIFTVRFRDDRVVAFTTPRGLP